MDRVDEMTINGDFKCYFKVQGSIDRINALWVWDFPEWYRRDGRLYFVVPVGLYKTVGSIINEFRFHDTWMTKHVLLWNVFKENEKVSPKEILLG